MAEPGRIVIDRSRRARNAVLLLLVALTALAGWTATPTGATTARTGPTVSGPVAKQAGPVLTRSPRGPLAGLLARAGHQVTQVQRSATADLPGAQGGGLLMVLGALFALVLGGRRIGLLRSSTRKPIEAFRELRRGRAPPTSVPTPA